MGGESISVVVLWKRVCPELKGLRGDMVEGQYAPQSNAIVVGADRQGEAFHAVRCNDILEYTDVQAPVRGCGLSSTVGRLDEVHGYVVFGKGIGEAECRCFDFGKLDDAWLMAANDV